VEWQSEEERGNFKTINAKNKAFDSVAQPGGVKS
jgi:hypothetical protein